MSYHIKIFHNQHKNKRCEERLPVCFYGDYTTSNQHGDLIVLDQSLKGLKIKTNEPISTSFIEVRFDDGLEDVLFIGEVKWGKKTQATCYYGLQLVEPTLAFA